MVVRMRFARGPLVHKGKAKNLRTLQAIGILLTPVSIACILMGVWQVSADLGWAQAFAITEGIFSHGQVWIAMGAAVQALAWHLGRRGGETADDEVSRTPLNASR